MYEERTLEAVNFCSFELIEAKIVIPDPSFTNFAAVQHFFNNMEYNHSEIDKKWQAKWASQGTYNAPNTKDKAKFYVLDMFPYPSGAGLHVGHPLGYIASDIYGRYKKQKGFNVLHPMGYDAFDCRQSNMPSKQDSTRRKQRK